MSDFVILQFSSSTAWQSAIIRKLSHSPFSHCDGILEDGNLIGASDSPDAPIIKGNPRGVAIRPPEYQPYSIRRNAIIKTDRADEVYAALLSQLGKPFDASAINNFLSDALPDERNWMDEESSWYCSELQMFGFIKGGYFRREDVIWPKARCSPSDLLLLFMLDPNFVNRKEFWGQLKGIKMGVKER